MVTGIIADTKLHGKMIGCDVFSREVYNPGIPAIVLFIPPVGVRPSQPGIAACIAFTVSVGILIILLIVCSIFKNNTEPVYIASIVSKRTCCAITYRTKICVITTTISTQTVTDLMFGISVTEATSISIGRRERTIFFDDAIGVDITEFSNQA